MRKVYYGKDLDSRNLNHYATERKDHKYIDRIPIGGGKFRYIYDAAKTLSDVITPPVNKAVIKYTTNETAKGVKKMVDNTNKAINDTVYASTHPIETATKAVTNGIKNTKKTIDDIKATSNKLNKAKTAITNTMATEFNTTLGKNEHMHSMNQGVVNGKSYKQVKADEEKARAERLKQDRETVNRFKNAMNRITDDISKNIANSFKKQDSETTTDHSKTNASAKKSNSLRGSVTGKNTTTGTVTGKKQSNEKANGAKYNQETTSNSNAQNHTASNKNTGRIKGIVTGKKSNSERRAAMEDSYYKQYIKAGMNPVKARDRAKKAADAYMKTH